MAAIRAIARSRVLLAPAEKHPLAMTKWWKKVRPIEGEITMHLSPHEQKIIIPWLKTFPKKTVDRFPLYLWPISSLALVYATMVWSEAQDYQEDYVHRF